MDGRKTMPMIDMYTIWGNGRDDQYLASTLNSVEHLTYTLAPQQTTIEGIKSGRFGPDGIENTSPANTGFFLFSLFFFFKWEFFLRRWLFNVAILRTAAH